MEDDGTVETVDKGGNCQALSCVPPSKGYEAVNGCHWGAARCLSIEMFVCRSVYLSVCVCIYLYICIHI